MPDHRTRRIGRRAKPRLSKSTYLTGKQFYLRPWHDFHARHLAAPADEALRLVFDTGHEVGKLACRRYPGGHLVAHVHKHVPEPLEETGRVIDAGAAPALFETAFQHEHVLVRADVLERLPGSGCAIHGGTKKTANLRQFNFQASYFDFI